MIYHCRVREVKFTLITDNRNVTDGETGDRSREDALNVRGYPEVKYYHSRNKARVSILGNIFIKLEGEFVATVSRGNCCTLSTSVIKRPFLRKRLLFVYIILFLYSPFFSLSLLYNIFPCTGNEKRIETLLPIYITRRTAG